MIKVDHVKEKGRGIIATEIIKKKQVIETSPTHSFSKNHRQFIDKTNLFAYYFVMPSEYQKKTKANKEDAYMVFGLSSFCNHSEDPNAKIHWFKNETGVWISLISIKNIAVNEEVTMSYANIEDYSLAHDFVDNKKKRAITC